MGISISAGPRRAPPPPSPSPSPLDYFPNYVANPNFPVHSPSVYYPYYNSGAYAVCNPAVVGESYLDRPFEAPAVPAAPAPSRARVVNSEVNVHKDSLRLEIDELNRDRFLVSFVFDALVDGSITIYYFAKVDDRRSIIPLFPETYVPIKVPFRKGLRQEFLQPSGTGIDFRFFALDDLSNPSTRDDIFPIVICADICPNPYMVDRHYLLAHHAPTQMQITQVVVPRNQDGQFIARAIRQLLWNDGVFYELREIYGLAKPGQSLNDRESGKDCVICMIEPKDTAVLPCRHMCMCSDCAKTLMLQSNRCPICRELIESVLQIKLDELT
ncbi:probable E3 ubiquitin-protein ligase LUL4 [Andrographis paniculata]|uniref:probable E3 ubiquitin-protein ligase LUL4 n=1 Tax=Andrographis paniculata TaxID=175694 RepID=UPI0021E91E0A|nr:probable E3 ubiquitin-protein ligase LUL4 [Andrographis paniculata]